MRGQVTSEFSSQSQISTNQSYLFIVLLFVHCIGNVDWLIRFLLLSSAAAMESTESYAAASPEELTKRSPEPNDSSEAGIVIFDPIWSFDFPPWWSLNNEDTYYSTLIQKFGISSPS